MCSCYIYIYTINNLLAMCLRLLTIKQNCRKTFSLKHILLDIHTTVDGYCWGMNPYKWNNIECTAVNISPSYVVDTRLLLLLLLLLLLSRNSSIIQQFIDILWDFILLYPDISMHCRWWQIKLVSLFTSLLLYSTFYV